MIVKRPFFLFAAFALYPGSFVASALDEVSGSNLTADEAYGARQTGLALTHAGFQTGADAVVNAPASMNDVNDLTFSTTHAERFGAARFDCVSLLVPWQNNSTFGLGLARFGVNGIENNPEGMVQPADPDLFNTADWLVSGSLARRFGDLDVAGTFHMLYRQLDQSGLGMRADAMAQYSFSGQYRIGTFIHGLVPSLTRWSSGVSEYEPSDASVFAYGRWEAPYFYGTLQAGWESAGLFQATGKSTTELVGGRGFYHPDVMIRTSKVGAEFQFDFGLSLRAGLDELDPGQLSSTLRLGAGYNWRHIVGIDYAFSPHPLLGDGHRVALQFTPSFPKFQGRGFRTTMGKPANTDNTGSGKATNATPSENNVPENSSGPPAKPGQEILEQE